jgi:VanZ family protein
MNIVPVTKRIPRLAFLGMVVVVISIAVLSLLPGSDLPAQKLNDKINHFIAYGVLAFLAVLGRYRMSVFKVVLLTIAYGLLLEALQGIMPYGRMASWLDAIANTGGVIVGLSAALIFEKVAKKVA